MTLRTDEQDEQRQAGLPVVADAVPAGPEHHQVRRRRDGVRKAAADATSRGFGETSSSPAAEIATGITMRAVAMLEISWPRRKTITIGMTEWH